MDHRSGFRNKQKVIPIPEELELLLIDKGKNSIVIKLTAREFKELMYKTTERGRINKTFANLDAAVRDFIYTKEDL